MTQSVITAEGVAPGVAGSGSDTVPTPAAGALWSWTVPSGYLVSFTTVLFQFNTDVTAISRLVRLQIKDYNARIIADLFASNTEPASSSFLYRFTTSVTTSYLVAVNRVLVPMDSAWHSPGTVLQTAVDNGQGADQFSGIVLFYDTRVIETATVEEKRDPFPVYPLALTHLKGVD